MQDRLILAKVNIDMYIDIAKRFNVRTVPTLLLVKSGKEVARLATGSYTLEQLQQELEPHL
jgi:thioredoxin-like negative regulator of GroEL